MMIIMVCCSCNNDKVEIDNGQNVTTLKSTSYQLTLPDTITAKEEENGDLTLFHNDNEIGGIIVIDYKDAEQLNIDDVSTDEKVNDKFEELLSKVTVDKEIDYSFEGNSKTGFFLSIIPWDKSKPETIHYFYPKGNVFYDLFLQKESITDIEEEILHGSFTLTS